MQQHAEGAVGNMVLWKISYIFNDEKNDEVATVSWWFSFLGTWCVEHVCGHAESMSVVEYNSSHGVKR